MGKFKITQSPASKNIFLYPESNGCVNDCFAFGDTPNFACVDDKWDALEPETTYTWMEGITTCSELYAMGNHGSITGSINYVKAHCKAKSDKYAPHVDAVYKVAISNGTTMGYTTLTLRPNAPGAFTQWLCATDPTHWEAVDEVVCDNFTTAIREGTNGDKDYFNLPNHTTETGTITKVEVFICANGNVDDATLNLAIYDTSSTNVINHSTTWTFAAGWNLQSHIFATNPDGGSWTWGDIDDLQIGVEKTGGTFPYVSQMYVEITYESGYICNGFAMSDNMPLCTGYGLFGFAWMESPWTDTDWTWDEVDNLQAGWECSSPSVIMTPFAVLPIADGDRTDITNVTTGYEHWKAIEKEKPYSEVFESGAAWKYDLYQFIMSGSTYAPNHAYSLNKFGDYVVSTDNAANKTFIHRWQDGILEYLDEVAIGGYKVATDGTYYYIGDLGNIYVLEYIDSTKTLSIKQTMAINAVEECQDIVYSNGYLYAACNSDDLRIYSVSDGTLAYITNSGHTSIGVTIDDTYIYTSGGGQVIAYTFNGTTLTEIDRIAAGDIQFGLTTDGNGNIFLPDGTNGLKAFSFDGITLTLEDTLDDGGTYTRIAYGGDYIFVGNASTTNLRAYEYSGGSLSLEGTYASAKAPSRGIEYNDGFIFTAGSGGEGIALTFNGTDFKEIFDMDNGNTPKYLTDDITSVTVIAKMGKDPSAADQADIRGCFIIKTGGSEFDTSADYFTLESKQRYYVHTYTENPDTVAAWTLAEVQALQAGVGLYGDGTHYATCSRCYIVLGSTTNISPEIKTCQTYLKVNYSPDDTVCHLPKPQEISTNHARNVKTLNFWNGEREVYDVNRSGKSMVLTGGITDGNPDVTNACIQIICVRDMTRDGTIITISGLNPVYFNGEYRINSFGWNKIGEKPENYEWILELESAY